VNPFPLPLPADQNQPFLFEQVNGTEERQGNGSFRNHAEAEAVVEWIRRLEIARGDDPHWYRSDKVRIISFYKAQVDLINRLLRKAGLGRTNLVATTVDSIQGNEAHVVILSFVRNCKPMGLSSLGSDREAAARKTAGFLTDDRRINVALTRSKYQLICIGNVDNMLKNKQLTTLHKLACSAQHRNCILGRFIVPEFVASASIRFGSRTASDTGSASSTGSPSSSDKENKVSDSVCSAFRNLPPASTKRKLGKHGKRETGLNKKLKTTAGSNRDR